MLQTQQFGRLLEPGLRKIFDDTYNDIPEQYSQVFKVQSSDKAVETDYRMGAFGLWDKKDSAGSVQYQDTVNPVALQYIHEEFASGFTVERKLIDDAMYNVMGKRTARLARSARATIETRSAEVINNSFTTNGFDGAPLISAAHKRLDGGYFSNQLGISVNVGTGATTSGTTGTPVYGAVANGQLSDRKLERCFNPST
jgi:phage major head subunit gpT-like protein